MPRLLKNTQCLSKMAGRNLQDNNYYLGERNFPDLQKCCGKQY